MSKTLKTIPRYQFLPRTGEPLIRISRNKLKPFQFQILIQKWQCSIHSSNFRVQDSIHHSLKSKQEKWETSENQTKETQTHRINRIYGRIDSSLVSLLFFSPPSPNLFNQRGPDNCCVGWAIRNRTCLGSLRRFTNSSFSRFIEDFHPPASSVQVSIPVKCSGFFGWEAGTGVGR